MGSNAFGLELHQVYHREVLLLPWIMACTLHHRRILYGVRDGTWTRDNLSHNQVFYHLNYSQHNSGTWDSNPEPRRPRRRILPFEIVPDCLTYFLRWGWRHSMLVTYHLKFAFTKKTIQILSFPMVDIIGPCWIWTNIFRIESPVS